MADYDDLRGQISREEYIRLLQLKAVGDGLESMREVVWLEIARILMSEDACLDDGLDFAVALLERSDGVDGFLELKGVEVED